MHTIVYFFEQAKAARAVIIFSLQEDEMTMKRLTASLEYQNICGMKFSRYLFSVRSEFGILIVLSMKCSKVT